MCPTWRRFSILLHQSNLPVKGFIETSFLDWKEELCSVIFTGGCNFRCPFCHNRDLVLNHKNMGDIPVEHIHGSLRKYKKWVGRVVVTGGEPTLQPGLIKELEALKKEGFAVKLDTNGSHPDIVKRLVREGLVDYIAMDIKGPLASYDRWCGVRVNRTKIRQSIDFILEDRVDYEFRMTFVPFFHKEHDAYEVAESVETAKKLFIQEFVPRETLDPSFAHIGALAPEKLAAIRKRVAEILKNAQVPCTLYH
jgi:pyruvate formate lyase activating enzyme